jgi:hypothetical protein
VPLTLKTTQKPLKGPQNPNFCLNYALSSLEARAKNLPGLGGRVCFIGGAARLERDHGARCVTMLCELYSSPRGDLIRHAAPPPNLPWFSRVYPFLTRFSGEILEAFWCSKWVMQHIFGNISTSTFQRYKF